MQAYFFKIINLDIYIERGGKEKNKTKNQKSKWTPKLELTKTSVRTKQFNLFFALMIM